MTQIHTKASSQSDVILRWTVHLAAQQLSKLVFSIVMIAFASVTAHWVIGPLGSVAVAIALVGSLAEFLFPVTYEITSDSAVCRTLFKQTEISWHNVRRYYLDNSGIKLSPLDRPSRLEAFRGVYLRFAGNDRQVIEAVRAIRKSQC